MSSLRATSALLLAALSLGLAACGEAKSAEDLSPEELAAKLQDRGFATGGVVTDGANVGVARGGKLDANAYLSVDADPKGERLWVGIYFFDSPEQAAVLAKEREPNEDRDFISEPVGSMVYESAGDPNAIWGVIAAAEAP